MIRVRIAEKNTKSVCSTRGWSGMQDGGVCKNNSELFGVVVYMVENQLISLGEQEKHRFSGGKVPLFDE